MAFQMHYLEKSLGGTKDEPARESLHCLLSILRLFPRGKLHFLVPSVLVALCINVCGAQKMLAWLFRTSRALASRRDLHRGPAEPLSAT